MKMTYTVQEATQALLKIHTNSSTRIADETLSVEIVPDVVNDSFKPVHMLDAYARFMEEHENIFPSTKGNAIKRLYELIPGLGLAECKCIVDADPGRVLRYYSRNKTFYNFR